MRYGDLPCCEWKPHTKYTLRWDLKPTPREETLAWYYTSGQKPMSRDLTGPKGEPTITMLLNEHSTICPLNSYLPNHKSRQLSNLIREAFCTMVDGTHNWSRYRECQWSQPQTGHLHRTLLPIPKVQGLSWKDRAEKLQEMEAGSAWDETVSSKFARTHVHGLIAAVVAYTRSR